MKAATIKDDGELVVEEHPDPEPGAGEVLVRVQAAGLNGADMLQRKGRYPAPPGSPPDIPGLELAGEVAALGPGARALRGGRPRDGDRRRRRAGRAGASSTSASSCRCPTRWTGPPRAACPRSSPPPTTRSSPRPACGPASACSSTARAGGVGTAAVQLGARGRRAGHRDRAQRGRCATASRARRPRSIDPEGFEEHGPVRRHPRARRRAQHARRTSRRSRRSGRIVVIGVGAGAKAELNLLRADGQARRASAPRRCARARSRRRRSTARAMEREVLPLFDARRAARAGRRRPSRSTSRRPPTSASPRAASSARSC